MITPQKNKNVCFCLGFQNTLGKVNWRVSNTLSFVCTCEGAGSCVTEIYIRINATDVTTRVTKYPLTDGRSKVNTTLRSTIDISVKSSPPVQIP